MATEKIQGNVSSQYLGEVDENKPNKLEKGGSTDSTKKKQGAYKGLQEVVFGEGEEAKFLAQVKSEYEFATRELKESVDSVVKRFKLYNNQKRNPEHIGEPLLFTHINSWMASLYDDQFDKVWTPAEEGDIETAQNMSDVAEYDYDLMNMDELKHNQDWDALFFSYSVTDVLPFGPIKKCMVASVIGPLGFYYDTFAPAIDGNSADRSGMRFLGWDMYLSERDIKDNPLLGDKALKDLQDSGTGGMSHKDEARKERLEALGGTYSHFKKDDMQDNNIYEVVHWRTMFGGKKVVCILTPKCGKILGIRYLPQDEKGNSLGWFVVAKKINMMPHQFKGVSLPDILEDKQRHKAQIINDQLNLARSLTYGSYVYDQTKVTNKQDLAWGYDKWIGVDGDPNSAIAPVRKDTSSLAFLDNTLGYIDTSAQKASATPELQQGVMSESQRTLGELNLIATSSKNRYSLALKTLAMGEREFWQYYYLQYKINFKEGLGEKIVRIGGTSRVFRGFSRKDLICKTDPDIKIESRAVHEARNQGKLKIYAQLLELILQDPDADKRASIKKALDYSGMTRQEIETILPPTSDELIAYEQNELLDKNKEAPFLTNDNHVVHLRVHAEAQETLAKAIHRKLHLEGMKMEQESGMAKPEQGMQPDEASGTPAPQGGQQMPEEGGRTPSQQASLINKMQM